MTRTARRSALILLAALGAPIGLAAQDSPVRQRTVYEDLQMFSQVLNQIRVNHPDSVDTHVLFMAAVEGMVRAADPHSYVITAARLSPEKERAYRHGDLVPVPITFRYVGGAPVVVAVDPGSDAVASGIIPGDELLAIDGEPVRAETALELDIVLAGRGGTEVALTFQRRSLDGTLVRIDRTVTREATDAAGGVPVALMLDSATGYVRVTTFTTEDVASELDDALKQLEGQGMQGLVLDLRANGGGLVDEAAAVAGTFLPRGTMVYTTSGRKAEVVDTGRVRRAFWKSERDYPVVLLVNEGTASASELVAGALQDHDRALVVGQPTFGKALLMQGFPLTDGSVMMLVIGKVHTPCGRTIQREYRDVSTREYYRAATDERDREGRETCRTDGGRTVYGGGGIYPDHVLEKRPSPAWLGRVHQEDLILRWVPGLLEERADRYADLEAMVADPVLHPDDLDAFLTFAADQGVNVPAEDAALSRLQEAILASVVHIRFGPTGLYTFLAYRDPDVAAAAGLLPDARALLGAGQ